MVSLQKKKETHPKHWLSLKLQKFSALLQRWNCDFIFVFWLPMCFLPYSSFPINLTKEPETKVSLEVPKRGSVTFFKISAMWIKKKKDKYKSIPSCLGPFLCLIGQEWWCDSSSSLQLLGLKRPEMLTESGGHLFLPVSSKMQSWLI